MSRKGQASLLIELSMAVKRVYLKDLHRMMDGMSIELAEKVHLHE